MNSNHKVIVPISQQTQTEALEAEHVQEQLSPEVVTTNAANDSLYPTINKKKWEKDQLLIIKNAGANFLQILQDLIKENVVQVNTAVYAELVKLYNKSNEATFNLEDLNKFKQLLKDRVLVNPVSKPGRVSLLSGIVNGDGNNDYLTLSLIKLLEDQFIDIEIIVSASDVDFYNQLHGQPSSNPKPSVQGFKKVIELVQDDAEASSELGQVFSSYLDNLQLASEARIDGTVSLLTNGIADESALKSTAAKLAIDVEDAELKTEEGIKQTIQKIKDSFSATLLPLLTDATDFTTTSSTHEVVTAELTSTIIIPAEHNKKQAAINRVKDLAFDPERAISTVIDHISKQGKKERNILLEIHSYFEEQQRKNKVDQTHLNKLEMFDRLLKKINSNFFADDNVLRIELAQLIESSAIPGSRFFNTFRELLNDLKKSNMTQLRANYFSYKTSYEFSEKNVIERYREDINKKNLDTTTQPSTVSQLGFFAKAKHAVKTFFSKQQPTITVQPVIATEPTPEIIPVLENPAASFTLDDIHVIPRWSSLSEAVTEIAATKKPENLEDFSELELNGIPGYHHDYIRKVHNYFVREFKKADSMTSNEHKELMKKFEAFVYVLDTAQETYKVTKGKYKRVDKYKARMKIVSDIRQEAGTFGLMRDLINISSERSFHYTFTNYTDNHLPELASMFEMMHERYNKRPTTFFGTPTNIPAAVEPTLVEGLDAFPEIYVRDKKMQALLDIHNYFVSEFKHVSSMGNVKNINLNEEFQFFMNFIENTVDLAVKTKAERGGKSAKSAAERFVKKYIPNGEFFKRMLPLFDITVREDTDFLRNIMKYGEDHFFPTLVPMQRMMQKQFNEENSTGPVWRRPSL